MTVDDLIELAGRNRRPPADAEALSPRSLSAVLRVTLDFLLQDLDYEADKTSGGAVAARFLAQVICCADEAAERGIH
jgi:hypothetical protein